MSNLDRAILILGTEDDPHVSRVSKRLQSHFKANVITLDYLNGVKFSCSLNQHNELKVVIDGQVLPNKLLIWDRDKILPGTHAYLKGDDNNSKHWAAREWKALFKLLSSFNKSYTINTLEAKSCLLKPYQQIIAHDSGFCTPTSLITNHKQDLIRFSEESQSGLIMKSLSGGNFVKVHDDGSESYQNVMTMRVSESTIRELDEQDLQYHPHFFQNEIDKEYELRVVVINQDIFAFSINSQESSLTELDWRRGISKLDYELIKLPESTISCINKFMKNMKLFTGSLDLIVDKKGQTFFIECNQDGAWGWLDDVLSGDIANSFAKNIFQRLSEL